MSLPSKSKEFEVDLSQKDNASIITFKNKFQFELEFLKDNFIFKEGSKKGHKNVFSSAKLCSKFLEAENTSSTNFVTIRCTVRATTCKNKPIIKSENAVIKFTTVEKKIKFWHKFMDKNELEKYSKDNLLKLEWKITFIENEEPMPLLPEKRLDLNFLHSETIYELRNIVLNKTDDPTEDHVRKVVQQLEIAYSTKNGLMKMFVDKLQIVNYEEKWQLKHSCSFDFENTFVNNFEKLQITNERNKDELIIAGPSGSGPSKALPSVAEPNVTGQSIVGHSESGSSENKATVKRQEKFVKAAKMEFELIKKSNAKCPANQKRHYVYFLIDPFIAKNLPTEAFAEIHVQLAQYIKSSQPFDLNQLINQKIINMITLFTSAIFYVGIGQGKRSLTHFDSARSPHKYESTNEWNKTSINEIWDNSAGKKGPILLHLIEGISEEEAKFRESYLMKKIGMDQLNNLIQEKIEINISNLNDVEKDKFLWYNFMFKAFFKFILEGENQVLK